MNINNLSDGQVVAIVIVVALAISAAYWLMDEVLHND